ncbi:hypothetical protein D3C71_2211970 [compost metagenome]
MDKSKQIAGTIGDKTQQAVQTISRQTSEWAGKAKETARSWKQGKAESVEASLEAPVAATIVEQEDNDK